MQPGAVMLEQRSVSQEMNNPLSICRLVVRMEATHFASYLDLFYLVSKDKQAYA